MGLCLFLEPRGGHFFLVKSCSYNSNQFWFTNFERNVSCSLCSSNLSCCGSSSNSFGRIKRCSSLARATDTYVVLAAALALATIKNEECSSEAIDPPKALRGTSPVGATLLVVRDNCCRITVQIYTTGKQSDIGLITNQIE